MTWEDSETLRRLLKLWLKSQGDLPNNCVKNTLEFVTETLADSEPDNNWKPKEF